METTVENVHAWLKAGMVNATIQGQGDGRHFQAIIVSPEFEGKNTLARHRLVYSVLGDKMDEAIHALSLTTLTPLES